MEEIMFGIIFLIGFIQISVTLSMPYYVIKIYQKLEEIERHCAKK